MRRGDAGAAEAGFLSLAPPRAGLHRQGRPDHRRHPAAARRHPQLAALDPPPLPGRLPVLRANESRGGGRAPGPDARPLRDPHAGRLRPGREPLQADPGRHLVAHRRERRRLLRIPGACGSRLGVREPDLPAAPAQLLERSAERRHGDVPARQPDTSLGQHDVPVVGGHGGRAADRLARVPRRVSRQRTRRGSGRRLGGVVVDRRNWSTDSAPPGRSPV